MSKVVFDDTVLELERILMIRFAKDVCGGALTASVIFDTGHKEFIEGQAALELAKAYNVAVSDKQNSTPLGR